MHFSNELYCEQTMVIKSVPLHQRRRRRKGGPTRGLETTAARLAPAAATATDCDIFVLPFGSEAVWSRAANAGLGWTTDSQSGIVSHIVTSKSCTDLTSFSACIRHAESVSSIRSTRKANYSTTIQVRCRWMRSVKRSPAWWMFSRLVSLSTCTSCGAATCMAESAAAAERTCLKAVFSCNIDQDPCRPHSFCLALISIQTVESNDSSVECAFCMHASSLRR